jgi:hypothetical protein
MLLIVKQFFSRYKTPVERNVSGAFTPLYSLDYKYLNNFKMKKLENVNILKCALYVVHNTNCKISPYLSNRFTGF